MPALLKAVGEADDRILEHSLTYALIEIGDPKGTEAGLSSENPRTLKAAMVALDQMDGGSLDPEICRGAAGHGRSRGSRRRRPGSSAGIVTGLLRWPVCWSERLKLIDLPPADRAELERQLGRFAQAAPIQRLLAAQLRDAFAPAVARRSSLQAMAWSNLKAEAVPREWVDAIASVLEGDPATPELVTPAVATLRALPLDPGKGGRPARPPASESPPTASNAADLRLAALAAVPGGLINPDQNLFTFLINQLDREQTVAARTTAADVLARARLTAEQLVTAG